MTAFFYRTEAKGIQSWILASDRLLELRGGSNILVSLDDEIKVLAKRCGGEVIVATAGGATLRFDDENTLQAFAEHWPLYVAQRAPGLQIVQAWAPNIGDVYRKLGEERNRRHGELPVAGPLAARSGRTGLAAVRRERDGALEDRIVRAKLAERKANEDALREKLLGKDAKWDFIRDAEDFGDGYIGVIHIDGNGVGRRIIEIGEKLEELKDFSGKLKTATETAARRTFEELIRRQKPRPGDLILARPIVLGGDDLTVIVHGRIATPFVDFYLREFQDQTSLFDKKITACAGIALVKIGWPFIQAHDLAQDLCDSAKRLLNREAGMLFHRITTADADLHWERIRNRELKGDGDRVLAGGPWEPSRLQQLDGLCIAASKMPRGALRGWIEDSRVSLQSAALRWDRLREVALERGTWEEFAATLTGLKVDANTGWDASRTPIPDALMWINLQSTQDGPPERLWSTS